MRAQTLATALFVCGLGCSDDPHGPSLAADTASVSSDAEPEVRVEAAPAASSPRAFVVKRPPPVTPPESLTEVAATEGEQVRKLTRWARDRELSPEVRYTSLRQLERASPDQAVALAAELSQEPDRLVRNNAIALLARSEDPRAKAAILRLSPRYQKLAAALRRRGR